MTPISTRLSPINPKLGQVLHKSPNVQHASFDSFKGRQPLFGGGSQGSSASVEDTPEFSSVFEMVGGLLYALFLEKHPYQELTGLSRDVKQYDKLGEYLDSRIGFSALLEERNFMRPYKPYIHTAIENGNYQGALLLASHAASVDQKDYNGKKVSYYIDQRRDLTPAGRKMLKDQLNKLYKLRTTLGIREFHEQMPPLRAAIPDFVRDLPRRA